MIKPNNISYTLNDLTNKLNLSREGKKVKIWYLREREDSYFTW
ncbi:hypothetical protein [Spiroplasma endosymbiont of Polydrusus formosus]